MYFSPCSGTALSKHESNTWDTFDKSLMKKRVDVHTIRQARLCNDYIACKSQMDKPFGVVPLSPLTTYVGVYKFNDRCTNPLLVHQLVRVSGCPNFLGLQIPVSSNLNIPSRWTFLGIYIFIGIRIRILTGTRIWFLLKKIMHQLFNLLNMLMNKLTKNCHMVLC